MRQNENRMPSGRVTVSRNKTNADPASAGAPEFSLLRISTASSNRNTKSISSNPDTAQITYGRQNIVSTGAVTESLPGNILDESI